MSKFCFFYLVQNYADIIGAI